MNLRRISLAFVFGVIVQNGYAQTQLGSARVKQAVDQVLLTLPEQYRQSPEMADYLKTGAYAELTKLSSGAWRVAMQNLAEVAPNQAARTVLFQSFENLSPGDYLEFLNQSLQLWEQNKISRGEFQSVFFPRGRMQFFISHNFDHPQVAVFLQKVTEVSLKKDDPIFTNVQEARTGELKRLNDLVRERHPELGFGPVPLLASSGNTGQQPFVPAATATPRPPTAPPAVTISTPAVVTSPPPQAPSDILLSQQRGTSVWLWTLIAVAVAGVVTFILRRRP